MTLSLPYRLVVQEGKRRQIVVVVVAVKQIAQDNLLQIVGAADGTGLLTGLAQRGQQHGGQDCDDGNHHQQLNESEGFLLYCKCTPRVSLDQWNAF